MPACPGVGVGDLEDHVDGQHDAGDLHEHGLDVVGDELLAGQGFHEAADQDREAGAGGGGGDDEQEEGPGPDEEPVAVGVGAGEHDAVHAAQGALVEGGQEAADAGEERHDHVHVMRQVVQQGDLVQLAVFKDQRHVLDDQDGQVAGDAEKMTREHGVDVGVPVAEPGAGRLADVQDQGRAWRPSSR